MEAAEKLIHTAIQCLKDEQKKDASREVALAITKLQEAEMWLQEAREVKYHENI